jgi:hypothetical protein
MKKTNTKNAIILIAILTAWVILAAIFIGLLLIFYI